MLLYPGHQHKNQEHPFETQDHLHGTITSHLGLLRFVRVLVDGKVNEGLGRDVLYGLTE